ncbi:hypothetical protein B1759_18945 [Rubrivirga sp. SAORIC476]|uniref:hypothetical protein n=1 Tax=Rubrivirga sp. SAORIC476 TaxID=1961794 RepID=UPI000BA96498|nr:hypothetical protein [Rubrivirga sp. SAORIC476]PAP74273.1 hypothetical protein B1759_18945 [Rubrivirga sp. SAORIC476]
MPDDLRPLRTGRYYSETELAAHALAAVHRVTGYGKPFPTRAALADALDVTPPALSAALALADPARPTTKYDRGAKVRRLILRRLVGFAVAEEPAWTVEEAPHGERLALPDA